MTLLRGGRVFSPVDPGATALLVDGDTVRWVGRDADAAGLAAAPDVVELAGALVTPAFVDAHVHTTSAGLALRGLDLSSVRSLAEALDLVERHARRSGGRPVLGHGWDQTGWPEHRAPTRTELDRAGYGGAVYLSRVDLHSAAVSSALLAVTPGVQQLLGYAESGHLTRDAHHAVRRAAWTSLTPGQRQDAQRATRQRAAELGIGSLHELAGPEISSAEDLTALIALAAAEPGPDVVPYWGELDGIDAARELGAVGAAGDLFADGSLGSRTACLGQPYADDPTSTGHAYLDADAVTRHVVACTQAGLQAGFHAIGDAAVRTVVAGFAAAADAIGLGPFVAARHRIEHVEMVDAGLAAELARLGVVASVQPVFDALWGGAEGMYAERLGADRALATNPLGTLAAAGVSLAFGSDVPVTPLGPWAAVRAAVAHHVPAQRLSPAAAFAAHTRAGWYAAGAAGALGAAGGTNNVGGAGQAGDGSAAGHAGAAGGAGQTGGAGGVGGLGDLVPGAPATFAVWAAPAVDATGLPDLAADVPLPTCLRTVVRGTTIFLSDGVSEVEG